MKLWASKSVGFSIVVLVLIGLAVSLIVLQVNRSDGIDRTNPATNLLPKGWHGPVTMPNSSSDVQPMVSCPDGPTCVVQTYYGLVVVADGRYRITDTQLYIARHSFGCGSVNYCVGLFGGDSGYVYQNGKFYPDAAVDPQIGLPLDFSQVTCPEANVCFGVGVDLVSTASGLVDEGSAVVKVVGRVWSKAWFLRGTSANSISCASRTLCFVVGNHEILGLYGNAWKVVASGVVRKSDFLSAISCPSPTYCVAVSQFGQTVVYDGRKWSTGTDIRAGVGGPRQVNLLSCWGTGNCLAGGLGTRVRFMLDGRWQPWIHSKTLYRGVFGLQDLSCSRAGTCAIVNSDGKLYWRSFT
jgi:hypothetical protein